MQWVLASLRCVCDLPMQALLPLSPKTLIPQRNVLLVLLFLMLTLSVEFSSLLSPYLLLG